MKLLYEAVVGYEDDGEAAMWGAGLYPDAPVWALLHIVEGGDFTTDSEGNVIVLRP